MQRLRQSEAFVEPAAINALFVTWYIVGSQAIQFAVL